MPLFQNVVASIENADALDGPADRLAGGLDGVLTPPIRSALSGVWLGHPAHPLLVTAPIGVWVSASALDATGGNEVAARRLVGLGIVCAAGAVVTGLSDWRGTTGSARRVGVVHMIANTAALAMYTASWRARVAGRHRRGALLALVGAGLLGAGGYLGGHLTYALGANVTSRERAGTAPADAFSVS